MSRSAAIDRRHPVRRSLAAPAAPRRLSGPLNPRHSPRAPADGRDLAPRARPVVTRPPLRIAAEGGLTLASAVAGVALDVSSSKLMDRLVRSRGWIVIVAFGLIGIVAMQVSMLRLNAGIGRAVQTIGSLERGNASLRAEMSRLSSGDRIQSLARARGFVMPAPADVTFLRAGDLRSDGSRAAERMQAPDRSIAGPAGSAIVPDTLANITGPPAPLAQTASAVAGAPAAAVPAPATASGTTTTAPGTNASPTSPTNTAAPGANGAATGGPTSTAAGANAGATSAPGATAPAAPGAASSSSAATATGGAAPRASHPTAPPQ